MKFTAAINISSLLRAITFAFAGFAVAGYILPLNNPEPDKFRNFNFLQLLFLWSLISTAILNHYSASKKNKAVHLILMAAGCLLLYNINIYCFATALLTVPVAALTSGYNPQAKRSLHYLLVLMVSTLSNPFSFMSHGWVILMPLLFYMALWPVLSREQKPLRKATVVIMMLAVFGVAAIGAFYPTFKFPDCLAFLILWFAAVTRHMYKYADDKSDEALKMQMSKLPSFVILINAAITAGFAGWYYGFFVFLLMPFSFVLYKTFDEI